MKILPAKSQERAIASAPAVATSDRGLDEYGRLKTFLLLATSFAAAIGGCAVWVIYGANVALNYVLGACVGVVYLRMLARSVDQLGVQKRKLGNTRLLLIAATIIIAARTSELKILPIFLGFMTYKVSILACLVRDVTRASR